MKKLGLGLALAALICGAAAAADSPIAGTWQGKMGDVPAVKITVKVEGVKIDGTATFYKIVDDGIGPKVAGRNESALIDAKLEDKILSFRIKDTDGALLDFQMKLKGDNEAELAGKSTQSGGRGAPPLTLKREP